MAKPKQPEVTEIQVIARWAWFFVLYYAFIVLIACFGLIAEF